MTKNEKLVNYFNELYPVGSEVLLRKVAIDSSEYLPYKVRYEAYIASSGDPVAFFEGISGYCSIEEKFINYPNKK